MSAPSAPTGGPQGLRQTLEQVWDGSLPERVRVVEVGPRDGLQNIDRFVPTSVKIALINRLVTLGFDRVEAVSFVHPRAVPQMRDAEAIMTEVERGRTRMIGLVPNERGTQRALDCRMDGLNFVVSASESFNQANLRQPIGASMRSLAGSLALARAADVPMRLTISTAFGCPYEGFVDPERVLAIAEEAAALGCHEICLGDTTGMANPRQVFHLFRALRRRIGQAEPAVHLHNTRGSGAANLVAALQAGVEVFDASIGGLGGCPYAPGATGNVCTEDMVHMLQEMDIETGIDLDALIDTARRIEHTLGLDLPGQVMRAGVSCAISSHPA